MNKIVTILLTAILSFVFFAGCQKTPDDPVVVQKDMEQMIEKGMAESDEGTPATTVSGLDYAALCAHYGVPERFQADINKQGVEVHADVAIELPETTALPMAHVVAGRFSQEQVYALFNALCGDTLMYIAPEMPDKAHYQEAILKYQALLASATDQRAIDSINSHIDYFKQQYEIAPDSIEVIPSDGMLQTRDVEYDNTKAGSGAQTYLKTASDPNDMPVLYSADTLSDAMQFSVYNDIDYEDTSIYSYVDEQGNTQNIAQSSGSSVVFQREADLCRYGLDGTELADVTALSLSGGAVDDCLLSITPQQARETVEQLMMETGLDDMVIDRADLYSSKEEPMPVPDEAEYADKTEFMKQMGMFVPDDQPETQGYVFRLLWQVNDVKVESDHDSSMTNMEGMSYGKEWMYEMLTVAVDDQGIANLYWTGPLNVTEMLTENTTIRPWNDIEGVFEKMMPIEYTAYTESNPDFRIDVTHASLSLQRIMEKDSFTTGLLVPVWNFYGTMTSTNDEGKKVVEDSGYFPLLSINAIDGSVINPLQGY